MTSGTILEVAPGETVEIPAGVEIDILRDGDSFATAGPSAAGFVLTGVEGLTFRVV